MDTSLGPAVARATGSRSARPVAHLQSVWSGWGDLVRFALDDGPADTVVVKSIRPATSHPRGWSGDVGQARKVRSYAVEAAVYNHWEPVGWRRPHAFEATPTLFVLEDLDAAGFSGRHTPSTIQLEQVHQVLDALAALHVDGLGRHVEGLWPTGTYWHLGTRPDELSAMVDGPLKRAAQLLDHRLRTAPFQTLVHGDAKLANVCFGSNDLALVDFQYTGGGPGIVDVVYFLGSCFDERGLHAHAKTCIEHYLERLQQLTGDADIAATYQALEPFAWADFERFLAGWAPQHAKRGTYAAAMTQRALARLS